ncbi:septum formation protein Maf, partial [bacterium]|nr:septum formation protein Maf [bacterium]
MEKIILASNSPRRKEILSKAGYVFDIYPSSYDEKISGLEYTDEIVENCAYSKAKDVHKNFPNHLIVASDTVVVLNGKILGKPKNQKDDHTMLQNLSSKTHFVATSICLIKENKVIKGIEKTYVTFRKLSEYDIEKYLNSQKP